MLRCGHSSPVYVGNRLLPAVQHRPWSGGECSTYPMNSLPLGSANLSRLFSISTISWFRFPVALR